MTYSQLKLQQEVKSIIQNQQVVEERIFPLSNLLLPGKSINYSHLNFQSVKWE